ncbi:MAG: prepilin-type N-terminal cleavage/methylation domain-containing protein [Desulfobacteraceae bacterium]|nr:MAG: prepilin-type N-terminal cleavage/methylation domain-containing protein [Desulfobacteraceae bacterium]
MNIDRKKERTVGESGFTLLEVIVAISILTFGLLAVASMQTTAIRGNYNASHITEATTFAQDTLEELLALRFTDAALADAQPAVGTPTNYAIAAPTGYTGLSYTVDDDNPVLNAKLITVTITWQDKGAQKQTAITCVKPRV